jgi:hypothetical protein
MVYLGVDIQNTHEIDNTYKNTHQANCFSRKESLISSEGNISYYLTLSAGTGNTYA